MLNAPIIIIIVIVVIIIIIIVAVVVVIIIIIIELSSEWAYYSSTSECVSASNWSVTQILDSSVRFIADIYVC